MQQHPVPQNITQYQFRLVGDMTLKQFFELAGGLLVAYLFFASNLLFFIKWPLVILSGFLGVGLAFFPIEERPLDQWIISFIKGIYAPTRYTWKKSNALPNFLSYTASVRKNDSTQITKSPPPNNAPEAEVLPTEEFDIDTKNRMDKISSLIDSMLPNQKGKIKESITKPSIAVRKLSNPKIIENKVVYKKRTPKQIDSKPVNIPASQTVKVEFDNAKPNTTPTSPTSIPETIIFEKPSLTKHQVQGTVQQAKTIQIPTPLTPKKPNIVVGIVTNPAGKLIDNAIVQITDQSGIPQRAVKTNQLGQFSISTPLANGDYIVEVEKDNLKKSPQQINVAGSIIKPLELQAVA